MPEMVMCPQCGKCTQPGPAKCDHCGAPLRGAARVDVSMSALLETPSPPSPAAGRSTENVDSSGRFKVVPFSAAVSSDQGPSHLASQIEGIISSYTSAGWEYVGVHQLQTFKAGSIGCFGLGATPPVSITTEFIVFRQ